MHNVSRKMSCRKVFTSLPIHNQAAFWVCKHGKGQHFNFLIAQNTNGGNTPKEISIKITITALFSGSFPDN